MAFFSLGILYGLIYDAFEILNMLVPNKIIGAVLDFIMMLLWSVMYFCVMLGYNNGEYRFYHSLITISALTLYLITVHRAISGFLKFVSKKINTIVKKISKKLKISKKSFKNLLHFKH